jgi:putative MATE family efflux protein
MMKSMSITNGSVQKTLILLMYPFLIAGCFQQLAYMTDGIIIGRYSVSSSLAVIGGSGSMVISIFNGFASGIISGAMFVLAYHYGAMDSLRTAVSVKTGIFLALVGGIVFTCLFYCLAGVTLEFLKVPYSLLDDSIHYLRLYSIGFTPYFLFQMCIGLMRATGETKKSTQTMILSFFLNIALDYLFVALLHLNSSGIALSFILTQCISLLFSLYDLNMRIPQRMLPFCLDRDILLQIFRIGLPSSVISTAYAFTNVLIQTSINLLGSDVIAAYAIHSKIDNFYWITLACLGTGMTTFFGQNFGAHKYSRMKKGLRAGILIGYAVTLGIILLYYFGRNMLTGLFTTDPDIHKIAASILGMMSPFYLAYPAIEIITPALKCLGKARQSSLITILFICGTRVLWILFEAIPHLSYQNILLCYPISWIITTVVFVLYYETVERKMLDERHPCAHRTVTCETAKQ